MSSTVTTPSVAKTASAVVGRIVSDSPVVSCRRAPTQRANRGPPIQTFAAMTAMSAPSPSRLSDCGLAPASPRLSAMWDTLSHLNTGMYLDS